MKQAIRYFSRGHPRFYLPDSTIEENIAEGLALRHDHGSNYMSDDFQNEIKFLGIVSSPSFVRALEGNECAGRFIRT